jgi:hypothetical protein
MAWLAKEIPKSEHKMEKVQTAAHLVTQAAEHNGPMIFARWETARCEVTFLSKLYAEARRR